MGMMEAVGEVFPEAKAVVEELRAMIFLLSIGTVSVPTTSLND